MRQAARILRDQPLRQRHIAERSCQEDVRFRAALQQESRHVRRLADTPLRRRRVVILVAGVDSSPMIQEQRRHRHCPRAMQGSPRVHPLRIDQRRVRSQHLRQLIGQPCPRGLMHRLVRTLLRHPLKCMTAPDRHETHPELSEKRSICRNHAHLFPVLRARPV